MWGQIEECMRTGKNAIQLLYGIDIYTYFDTHHEEEIIFNAAMVNLSRIVNRSILAYYDFSHVHRLVDLGGGNGSLIEMILSHYPMVSGELFDRSSVITQVKAANEKRDLGSLSYKMVSGNFFDSVPPGADAYLLKYVLHNWNDEQCCCILRNCCRGMHSSTTLLICEQLVVSDKRETDSAKEIRLLMALQHEGHVRTQEEFSALFAASGLRLVRVIPTDSPIWILEAMLR
ncbi:MAG: methyltransferase [Ktedonobacteraceae bacterium]